jgi:hypothetical protein
MFRTNGMPRVHGCTGAAMFRTNGPCKPLLRLQDFRHPWRSCRGCMYAHDCMDAGGRATQDAKAEERRGSGRTVPGNPLKCAPAFTGFLRGGLPRDGLPPSMAVHKKVLLHSRHPWRSTKKCSFIFAFPPSMAVIPRMHGAFFAPGNNGHSGDPWPLCTRLHGCRR